MLCHFIFVIPRLEWQYDTCCSWLYAACLSLINEFVFAKLYVILLVIEISSNSGHVPITWHFQWGGHARRLPCHHLMYWSGWIHLINSLIEALWCLTWTNNGLSKYNRFLSKKCIWTWCLLNSSHLVRASRCWSYPDIPLCFATSSKEFQWPEMYSGKGITSIIDMCQDALVFLDGAFQRPLLLQCLETM